MFGEMYIFNKNMSFLLDGIFNSVTYTTISNFNDISVEISINFLCRNEQKFNVFDNLYGKLFNFVMFYEENGRINKGSLLHFPIMGIDSFLLKHTTNTNIYFQNGIEYRFTLNIDYKKFYSGIENVNPKFF